MDHAFGTRPTCRENTPLTVVARCMASCFKTWDARFEFRKVHGRIHTLCSYKQDLKKRIFEDLGPCGAVVPMQGRNNTAKVAE